MIDRNVQPTIEEIFAEIDADRSGFVELAEFEGWWHQNRGDEGLLQKFERAAGGGGFRLNLSDETMLGASMKATKRQQLLMLRAKGERAVELPEGGVPLSERDIPDHLLDQNEDDKRETALLSSQLPGLAEADDRATMSRRDLGVASIALGGVLRDLAGASPAEAKKIVSGYVPARGIDVRAR